MELSDTSMSKPFKEYKFQIINHTDKEIIYSDVDEEELGLSIFEKQIETLPIGFRKKISNKDHKGYKVRTR